MFFNIIIFFIILISLTLILKYSKTYKEGFFDFPDPTHNSFVESSKAKFNTLTNTVNLLDPAVPITPDGANALQLALNGLNPNPTPNTYNLQPKVDYTIPTNGPDTFKKATMCQSFAPTCGAFDNAEFAANCGMSFDINGMNASNKPFIGGLFVSPDDRQKQTDAANIVLSTATPPYDPYKVYQPTLGKAKPGTFALTKDQCVVVKEKVECAAKQTFSSPNCTQCYTSQNFARVGPETQRIPSSLFLFGNGNVSVWTSDTPEKNIITIGQTQLDTNTPVEVNIPGDAEGTTFVIFVDPIGPKTFVAGYIQGETPRGTFKLDLMSLVQSDLVTNSKPRLNGSLTVNGFRCFSIVPGAKQTNMRLSCLIPFSFLSMYDGDALTCDNGPIITQAASATFLESDPCYGKDNQPGNYKLECLQTRWIELGGTQQGTGYPANKAAADAIQKDSNGQPLDIDTIVENLANKITPALTGTGANGNPLSLSAWNDLSMWATGIPINTPCDGPNQDTGPLSQECLSYLYLNQGVTSHIGPTYTSPSSQLASMKGQDLQNTYCQPGTAIDPATPGGLQFGQSLGGVTAVKQTYDQINRLANDNTQSNSARAQAVQQCYGVSIDPKATGKSTGPTQVFAVSGPGGQSYKYTQDQAAQVCSQYGAQVATTDQVQQAQQFYGADWCFTGWVSDSNSAIYPISTSTQTGCGNGNTGIINFTPSDGKAGVNCYGPKPGIDNYPIGTILPFSQSSWDQPTTTSGYLKTTGGYLETSGPQPSCFNGLSIAQAQKQCDDMGSQCAGFSYSTDGTGNGCFKGDVKGGFNANTGYVGYTKASSCPNDTFLYGQSAGGFCCPVAPTNIDANGQYNNCPQPSVNGQTLCSLGPNTQGNPRCP
jgi:hypothetical protein